MYGWRRPEENAAVPPLMPAPVTPAGAMFAPGTLPMPSVGVSSPTGPVYSTPMQPPPMNYANGSGSVAVPAPGTPIAGTSMPAPVLPGAVGGMGVGLADPCVACQSPCCGTDGMIDGLGFAAAGGNPFANRFYLGAEYLLWSVKGDRVPPLVTQAPPGGAPALGVGGTHILYGNRPLGNGPRSGGRLNMGWWFDPEHSLGVDVGGFFLAEKVSSFSIGSAPGGPVIGRPFFNVTPGFVPGPDYELVGGTDINGQSLAGNVEVRHSSSIWGYDVNLRRNWLCGPSFNVDWLVGYRQMGLDETLNIRENLNLVDGSGANVIVQDRFQSQNRFYGAQVGLIGELWLYERVSLGGFFKLGMGYTQSRTSIDGITAASIPGQGAFVGPGGLYTGVNNIGTHRRHSFSVIPELGFNMGYSVTDWMRLTVGYNFLYWTNVARPGGQVDTTVNLNNVFGSGTATSPLAPQRQNNISDFWAHGVTFGLEFRY
jgi:hypothetical protein